MVTAPEKVARTTADPSVGAFNPSYEQPWENLSVVVGVPFTVITAGLTLVFAMAAVRDPLLGWAGVAVLWTLYFPTMALLWAGVAGEMQAR